MRVFSRQRVAVVGDSRAATRAATRAAQGCAVQPIGDKGILVRTRAYPCLPHSTPPYPLNASPFRAMCHPPIHVSLLPPVPPVPPVIRSPARPTCCPARILAFICPHRVPPASVRPQILGTGTLRGFTTNDQSWFSIIAQKLDNTLDSFM